MEWQQEPAAAAVAPLFALHHHPQQPECRQQQTSSLAGAAGVENFGAGVNWARSEGSVVPPEGSSAGCRPPSPHTIAKWVEEALRCVASAGVPATREKILSFIWTKYKVPMELEKRVQQSVDATLHRGMRRKELIMKNGIFRVTGRRSAP